MKARPTILGLMGVIAFVAIGMAALRTNDQYSAAIVLALTVSALCTATVVALYRRGAWAGFAVFGWAQFLICQPHAAPNLGPTTLTTELACRLLPYINTATNLPDISFRIPGYPAIMSDGAGRPFMGVVSGGSASIVGSVPLRASNNTPI
jgi:hypothetical protein